MSYLYWKKQIRLQGEFVKAPFTVEIWDALWKTVVSLSLSQPGAEMAGSMEVGIAASSS